MTQQELKAAMSKLLNNTKMGRQELIATAVQLGMNYQEEKIRDGINIVFDELHGRKSQKSQKSQTSQNTKGMA